MSNEDFSRLMSCLNDEDGFSQAFFKQLIDNCGRDSVPELCALYMMDDMIASYRRDVLRLRREYKRLRDQEAAQALSYVYIRQRLKDMDVTIRRSIETWQTLRYDFAVQRTSFLKQLKHKSRPEAAREKANEVNF